jgi:pimeloyl-ACP methyl ester carboxylesterase
MMPAARRRSAGAPGAGRMLLLHGLGGRASAWDDFVDGADGMHVRPEIYDVELPWSALGAADWCYGGAGDPVQLVTDLVAGAGEPFDVVVAHSFAAGLLLEALAAGTVRPRAVVLLSPFYRAEAKQFDWPTISYYLNDFHLVFAEALRVGPGRRFAERHRAWLGERLRDVVGPYGWMSFFQLYLRTPFLRLADVAVPVLVVCGDADIAVPPSDSRELVAALPGAVRTELPGCGHFPMLEQPGELLAAVDTFLTNTYAPAGSSVRPAAARTESM